MDHYGIRGSTHKWINSLLSGRTQQVVLDGQASDPVPVLSGVPQGSVLGPILLLIFMPPKELWEAYSYHTVRPSVPLRVWCISPIFFEVGIPNLVCGCILGWRSVAYHFRVTVTLTLTSDLVFIVIKCPSVLPSRFVSGAYLLYSLR